MTAPAVRPLKPAAPSHVELWSPGKNKPFLPLDNDQERLKVAELKQWLIPMTAIFVGWGIPLGYVAMRINLHAAFLLAPFVAILLGIKAAPGLVVCRAVLRYSDGTVGNVVLFILRVAGAVSFATGVGLLIPTIGFWVIEPLVLWVLGVWFLEFSLMEGFVMTLFNKLFFILLSFWMASHL
jgi:hypothetical protein